MGIKSLLIVNTAKMTNESKTVAFVLMSDFVPGRDGKR